MKYYSSFNSHRKIVLAASILVIITVCTWLFFVDSINNINVELPSNHVESDKTRVGIVALAKREQRYIVPWVKYHLALGVRHIYLYDNEDVPTYAQLLSDAGIKGVQSVSGHDDSKVIASLVTEYMDPFSSSSSQLSHKRAIIVKHFPTAKYVVSEGTRGPQYAMLSEFFANTNTELLQEKHGITHIMHIDIDEYVVLHRHRRISDFAASFLPVVPRNTGSVPRGSDSSLPLQSPFAHCCGIYIYWYFFGSNGRKDFDGVPDPVRFTKRSNVAHPIGKYIVNLDAVDSFTVHTASCKKGRGTLCKTNGEVASLNVSDLNPQTAIGTRPTDVLQLNHYASKTLPEFKYIRKRGKSDLRPGEEADNVSDEMLAARFHVGPDGWGLPGRGYDVNHVSDMTAHDFYIRRVKGR